MITGAAQGIGRRTAMVMADQGYALALNDIKSPDDVASDLKKRGVPVLAIAGDVSLERDVDRIHRQVIEAFGRADVLVNNAGISSIHPALEIDVAEWRRVMDVNLLGPFLMCRAFGRDMVARGRGSIINIASVAGLLGIAERAAYNASKHGLIGLTRTLAAEWGARGVRVNAVCPGWVKTPMDVSATSAGHYVDADIEGRVPMGRFATTDDIAQAILFLADPTQSGFINGHTLSVDGGWFADGSWESLRRRQQGKTPDARSSG
jgi:NAD(P)-dependent dehydrogenase (short-subunit alcohol dehydrogenase family)